jgi:hypothetical protein
MKKQYRMAIEKVFFAELQKIDPQFEKISVKALIKYDGETIFSKNAGAATLFICLVPHPKGREEFVVEIGWSSKHRFPVLSMRPSILKTDMNKFEKDEGMLRLTEFTNMNSFGWEFKGVESEFNEKYFTNPEVLKSTPKEVIDRELKRVPSADEAIETVKGVVYESIAVLKNNGLPYLNEYLKKL